MNRHVELVMGTAVAFVSPDPLPQEGIEEAVRRLHHADRVFSTWDPDSPMSRLRGGNAELGQLDPLVPVVLERCRIARALSGGLFDPWAMPGGLDPTGLVKGWAAAWALDALRQAGVENAMVNAGGDIAVLGSGPEGAWRVGIRHPAEPDAYCAVIRVEGAVATSGDYERPGQLIDPSTGRSARAAVSATVTGPELDLADALATALAVGGTRLLSTIDRLNGYEAYLITKEGRHFATPGMPFVQVPVGK